MVEEGGEEESRRLEFRFERQAILEMSMAAFKWNSLLTRWIDAMLIADYFPEFRTDLITTLASCGWRRGEEERSRLEAVRD